MTMFWLLIALLAFVVIAQMTGGFGGRLNGWKTTISSVLIGGAGFLDQFDFASIVDRENIGYTLIGVAVLSLVLRAVTKGPWFSGE